MEKSYKDLKRYIKHLNLLIVTAADVEKSATIGKLQKTLDFEDIVTCGHEQQTYTIGKFGIFPVVHVNCNRIGSAKPGGSINTVSNAIRHWKPKVVLMVGIAMGKNKKQKIGTVLVSESVVTYEHIRAGKTVIARNTTPMPGTVLFDRFKNITDWNFQTKDNRIASLETGSILSGEKLIDDPEVKKNLFTLFPECIGAEMEGEGVSTACINESIPEWIIVKGICDYGDGKKGYQKKMRQETAINASLSACLNVFSKDNGFRKIGLSPCPTTGQTLADKSKLIEEIIPSDKKNKQKMQSSIKEIVDSVFDLNQVEKININRNLDLNIKNIKRMVPHEVSHELLVKVKKENLFKELWDELNKIKPFKTQINPFI